MNMYRERFAKNLMNLCKGKAISSIGKECGIPHQTLQHYIHNEREIGIEYLVKLADYFDVTLDELTGRDED